MIRGYFVADGARRRPFVRALFEFPTLGRSLSVELLVDTGADRTVLAPLDARKLGIDLTTLPSGGPSTGVGGRTPTRTVGAVLTLQAITIPLVLTVLDSPPGPHPVLSIPSLLGRDVLAEFGLFVEQRTNRVLLLEPHEADTLMIGVETA